MASPEGNGTIFLFTYITVKTIFVERFDGRFSVALAKPAVVDLDAGGTH
jgi:hypothetical protein